MPQGSSAVRPTNGLYLYLLDTLLLRLSLHFTTLYKIFVLTCLRMAQVKAETCSTNVKVQFVSKLTSFVLK